MPGAIAPIDLWIIAGYFAVVFAIGWWVATRTETGSDLFLAGRSLGFATIGLSLFASNISSTTLIGLAGSAYTTGIAAANYEWMAAILFLFMAVFTIPVFLRARITTIPEWLEKRFDWRSRRYFSALTVFLSIVVDTAGGLYAGAVTMQVFFPGLPLWQTAAVLALIAGVYTAAGGLKAVVYTDVLQAVVLLVGSTTITVLVFAEYDFSWAAATAELGEQHLSLILPADSDVLPWTGLLVGVPILGFYYWSMNQYIVQRVLGARDVSHARWGGTLAGFLKLFPLFVMVLPGAMAVGLFPDLENGDKVFPTLVTEVLPAGLTGLVLAGLVAAIMSSIDSTLNAASTLITHDFVAEMRREPLSGRQRARVGRLITLTLMVVAAIWAPMIANFQGLWAYLQQMFAVAVPPVVAVFVIGLVWRGGSSTAAIWTLVLGHAFSIAMFVAGQAGWHAIHFTVTAGINTAVAAAIFLAISTVGERVGNEKLDQTVWRPADARPDRPVPWYLDYRLQAGAVAILCALMVAAFW
ncbi:MAG: sodium/solute symporter [Alphaproteobacteria bacterium]|jgi:SSS family solute:Na+ symporter|nr:sodium/solute symporter [Alphaproteobacteria bacterium]